jgi:hypothetical protein
MGPNRVHCYYQPVLLQEATAAFVGCETVTDVVACASKAAKSNSASILSLCEEEAAEIGLADVERLDVVKGACNPVPRLLSAPSARNCEADKSV